MRIYLINLARRPDRLAGMLRQAAPLGLHLERVEALDAVREEPESLDRWFEPGGPLGEIPKGDKACLLSHRQAWRMFLASGDPHAAFLEDDVRLSRSAPALLLTNSNWLPEEAGVVKLEHYGPPGQRVLLGGVRPLVLEPQQAALAGAESFRIGRMLSRHTGAAAYILSRDAAQMLMAENLFDLPVDHLLFNPNNSRLFARLKPWQLLPAIARQEQNETSDIEATRLGLRRFGLTYAKRELVRFGYDLRLLPRQLGALLGGAKFVAMTTAG